MVKPKQKKPQKKINNKRKIFLIVIVAVFILCVGWFVVRMVEDNIAKQEEEKLFDRSFAAIQVVYDQFYDRIAVPKQKTLPVHGQCSSAGKYSTLYNCGPEADITVTELDERQYRDLNQTAVDIYRGSISFDNISTKEPYENGLDPGLTSIAGARLKGSGLTCYYLSNYVPEKKTATFSWSCKRNTHNRYYSTAY